MKCVIEGQPLKNVDVELQPIKVSSYRSAAISSTIQVGGIHPFTSRVEVKMSDNFFEYVNTKNKTERV